MAMALRLLPVSAAGSRSPPVAAAAASQDCVVAVDVGTGGTKACLVSSEGKILASGFAPHPPPTRSPLKDGQLSLEQDQELWWSATARALRLCCASANLGSVHAITLTGQMQDVILVPKAGSGTPTRNAILYSDARALVEVDEISNLVGGSSRLAETTGSLQGASSVLAKLRWINKYEPDAVQSCNRVLFGGHDYVAWRLCGAYVTDTTTVSTTGLSDSSFQYAEELMQKAGLRNWMDKLPDIVASDAPCGEVHSHACELLGLPGLRGIPVIHACGDAGACTLGAGAAKPGDIYGYLGTSGWVAGTFPRCKGVKEPAPGVFTLGHPDSSYVFKTGSIMTAGQNLAWASQTLLGHGDVSFDVVNELAAASPCGCGGLLYLPFLNGERCPFDDPNARAVFLGMSASTTAGDMLRAVMEGVGFALRSARHAMAAGQDRELLTRPVRLVGGGARSPLWPSILSGVLGQPVDVLEDPQDVGVKGAALLAGKWLGWHGDLCPGGHWLRIKSSYAPTAAQVEEYDRLYAAYVEVCQSLRGVFQRLSWQK